MLSTLPTTSHYIQFHATARPKAWAIHTSTEDVSYEKLCTDLRYMTKYVGQLTQSLNKHTVVEVCIDDTYLNWLVILALENLAICSSSVGPSDISTSTTDVWPVSLILYTGNLTSHTPIPLHRIDKALLQDVQDNTGTPFGSIHNHDDDTLRITKTSGTTGYPKRMALTRNRHDGAMARWQWLCHYNPRSVCWIHAPFSVGGMYSTTTACLRAGGAVVLNQVLSFRDAWFRYGVTHATMLPIELTQVLQSMGELAVSRPKLMLTTFGGAVSLDQFDRALATFAHDVIDVYGTNEVGLIGIKRRHHFEDGLVILPGVEVEICDEQGIGVPAGLEGHLRARTLQMVPHYVDSENQSGGNFKDGWFWPGDSGQMTNNGLLKLLGRQDDLLNMGGIKINPDAIEAEFKKLPYLLDVAMVMNPSNERHGVITVAIVPKAPHATKHLNALILSKSKGFSEFMVVQEVSAIPRTATGKVERNKLKNLLK